MQSAGQEYIGRRAVACCRRWLCAPRRTRRNFNTDSGNTVDSDVVLLSEATSVAASFGCALCAATLNLCYSSRTAVSRGKWRAKGRVEL